MGSRDIESGRKEGKGAVRELMLEKTSSREAAMLNRERRKSKGHPLFGRKNSVDKMLDGR